MFDIDAMNKATDEAVNDPRVGDRFHEMYSFWVYVVGVHEGSVATLEASAPCVFPNDGKLRVQSKAEFKKRFSYGSVKGYWVSLADRGNNVDGWISDIKFSSC